LEILGVCLADFVQPCINQSLAAVKIIDVP
jgi:hypothetical protein